MIYNKHLPPNLGILIVDEDTEDILVSDIVGNQRSGQIIIRIEDGVTVRSSSLDAAAIYNDVESIFAMIENYGFVYGKGGVGGMAGAGASGFPYTPVYYPSAGGDGGVAIKGDGPCGITNYGVIGGGGGGGGGASGMYDSYIGHMSGGGGGGGGGYGVGGSPHPSGSYGTAGSSGGAFDGGGGGANYFSPTVPTAFGGYGGAIGRDGLTGDSWQHAGAAGGLAGYYIYGLCSIGGSSVDKGECTISNASPCVVTLEDHGLITGARVSFSTTDELPASLVAGTIYFAIKNDDDTFWLASSLANAIAGTKIATTTDGSGTHSMYYHGTFLGRVV